MTRKPSPITNVTLSHYASKQAEKLPYHIRKLLLIWMRQVRFEGIRETRRLPGLHDEPLQGKRWGQRSVRLNRSYRAIYKETIEGIEILILEVNKHDY